MMLAKMVTHNGRPSRFFMIFIPSISFDNRFMVCYIYVKVLPICSRTAIHFWRIFGMTTSGPTLRGFPKRSEPIR